MSGNELKDNIHIYKKKTNLNIGVILFGVILVYLVVTILTYVTAKHVSVYEVREGSILKDNSYTGVVLREEMLVTTSDTGYINYLVAEGGKVGKLTNVYSISSEPLEFSNTGSATEEGAFELTSEEQAAIILKAQTFTESHQNASYGDTYQFKEGVEGIISSGSAQSRQAQLEQMLLNSSNALSIHTAAKDGIIIYSTDGYENLRLDNLLTHMVSRADYQKKELSDNTQVASGETIYKLITDNEWMLVIELDDEMAQTLAEANTVKLRFKKDNQIAKANFSLKKVKEQTYGVLSFHHSIVRYATERFLDIELILEDESGLKIPKSSVVEKEFYLVPEDYMTKGGNSSASGVLVKNKNNSAEFTEADVYYRDNETGMVYLEVDNFKRNTVLVKPDSDETYLLTNTDTLSGVYDINKGYAIFRQIYILCESDEYYIVQSGSTYGLTNYDHIALDGTSIHENDIVF